MTVPRLKAYRKSVLARKGAFEHCHCGDPACDYERFKNQEDKHYQNSLIEIERVNKELARKQTVEREAKKNAFYVPTVREHDAFIARKAKRLPHMDTYHARKAERKAAAKAEEARGLGRTVTFHYDETGFDGRFIYDTPALAQTAAKRMRKRGGFSNVEIV